MVPRMMMVLLFFAVASPCQAPPAGAPKASPAPDYTKESFVIEQFRTLARFENDGTDIRVVTGKVSVGSEAGVQKWGVLSVGYSSANEQAEFGYVRVRKADGTVVDTPADSVQDMTSEVTRIAPMYSDFHEKHVAVRGLGVGDLLEYQITTRLRTPLIPGQFWSAYDFEKTNIALDEELEINVPKDREVKVKSSDLKPVVREEGDRRIYAWKTANRERKENEEPVRELPPPAVLVSTFRSWDEVGRWWNGLEQERVTPTPEVRAKAAELTKDAKTYEDKVRALYDYVATHFRYISISFGIGRYQPHAAGEVLKNEYGDCKDKHTLLASLLAAAGIEAEPALMNSARKIDPDVPSPGQFDHVISAVPEAPHSGKLIWLDTTTEVAPFGLLFFNLRDKQALLIPSAQPALLGKTPADPPFKNFQSFKIDAKLSEAGVLEGKVERAYRGDTEVLLRAVFRQAAQSQWKDVVQGISRAGGFAGDVSEVEVSAPESTREPFRISYKYTRKDYPDWANHRISPPVGFVGYPEIKDDPKRTQPLLLGPREEIIAIAKVELPKGYRPRLGQAVDLTRDFAEYHSKYAFQDSVFTTEVHEVIKKSEVPLSALDDYKSLQKAVSDDLNRFTDLSGDSALAFVPPPSSNAEAASLLDQAREAFQRRDVDGASNKLERALKLDDHFKDAWLVLGDVRLDQGRFDEGLTDFRKAIDLDPKDTRSYMELASAYVSLRRTEEAIKVWREVLKQDPNHKGANISLGETLLRLKRYDEAVPELEATVELNRSSASLKLDLADAYLGAGKTEKAVAALKEAGETAYSADIWNRVAYTLADHNLSLPDAQLYAVKALHSIEDRAAQTRLAELAMADLDRMVQLARSWDTLGWVYFREGDLERAQRYVEAAWSLEQNRGIGQHLAQIYEKQGKKAAAIHQSALAQILMTESGQFAPTRPQSGGGIIHISPEDKAARDECLKIRQTKLGELATKQGGAQFYILLAPGGKVEDVKFIKGDEHIRSLSKALTSLTFKAPLPDDAPVKLVRRGTMVCKEGDSGCVFTLFPPEFARSFE